MSSGVGKMITKELIKAEVDRVQDKYLEVLYRIIKALESPIDVEAIGSQTTMDTVNKIEDLTWHDFVEETYGSLANAPIERGDQGQYEVREAIR